MATMADALACDMMTLATSGSCIPAIGLAPRIALGGPSLRAGRLRDAARGTTDPPTTRTTGQPRWPGGRPRSRSAGPWVSPSDIRRARGAGASSRPGVRPTLTQTPKRANSRLRAAPGGPQAGQGEG